MKVGRRARITVAVLAILIGLFVFQARRFFFRKHYDVVSIATAPEFQEPTHLANAFALPVGALYKQGPITYQSNGSVCGPTSIADVMRSLGDHAATPESVIEGTGKCGFFDHCIPGITLDELAEMARQKTHKDVTVLRDLDPKAFHEELTHVNDPSRRYIVNFDRGPLFGTAGGHHSPIAAYLADEDLVLVIDVNAKYQPWLVKSDRLYTAMTTVDPSTGKQRGLIRIQ